MLEGYISVLQESKYGNNYCCLIEIFILYPLKGKELLLECVSVIEVKNK